MEDSRRTYSVLVVAAAAKFHMSLREMLPEDRYPRGGTRPARQGCVSADCGFRWTRRYSGALYCRRGRGRTRSTSAIRTR